MNKIMNQGPLLYPQICWDNATPSATAFEDIYFNPEDGLAETRHVFLQGTDLTEVWARTQDGRFHFTIGELGFGTGLNVLAVWQLWREHKPSGGRLHIISVEGYPLNADQLEQAHGAFPELEDLASRLRAALPPRARGHHLLHLDDDVSLHLLYGEAAPVLARLEAQVDAWFLDGFSPAKNETMWSPEVMAEIARCSAAGARLASFTVAGDVRRGLQEVGFEVEKAPGFGRKRHMLKARYAAEQKPSSPEWFARPKKASGQQVAVIGAGIAGTCLGLALTRAGFQPTLIDAAAGPARNASATPAGIVIPRLAAEADANARLYASAFNRAVEVYEQAGVLSDGGALRLPRLEEDLPRLERTLETGLYDPATVELLTAREASERAGAEMPDPALYFVRGGAVATTEFLIKGQDGLDVHYGRSVSRLVRDGDRWLLLDENEDLIFEADVVVVAAGMASLRLLEDLQLPLIARNGQIAKVADTLTKIPVAYGGYLVPQVGDGADNGSWIGTTHDRVSADAEPIVDPEADHRILSSLAKALPGLEEFEKGEASESWAGIRATLPDFVPVAGPVPDRKTYLSDFDPLRNGMYYGLPQANYREGLYALTGLGSRGFVTAPLLAELIAAQIAGTALPVDRDIAQIVHPGRFLIRNLVRGPNREKAGA